MGALFAVLDINRDISSSPLGIEYMLRPLILLLIELPANDRFIDCQFLNLRTCSYQQCPDVPVYPCLHQKHPTLPERHDNSSDSNRGVDTAGKRNCNDGPQQPWTSLCKSKSPKTTFVVYTKTNTNRGAPVVLLIYSNHRLVWYLEAR